MEKASSWTYAVQEILKPEEAEFDPDIKDVENVEVAISFAIKSLNEASRLCQEYKKVREDVLTINDSGVEAYKQHMIDSRPFRKSEIQDAQKDLLNLEKKIQDLKSRSLISSFNGKIT